jgi:hypothetical protein
MCAGAAILPRDELQGGGGTSDSSLFLMVFFSFVALQSASSSPPPHAATNLTQLMHESNRLSRTAAAISMSKRARRTGALLITPAMEAATSSPT